MSLKLIIKAKILEIYTEP